MRGSIEYLGSTLSLGISKFEPVRTIGTMKALSPG
jgi:hypothetical protein